MNKILNRSLLWASLVLSKPVLRLEETKNTTKIEVQDIINDTGVFIEIEKNILNLDITLEEKKLLLKILKEEEIRESIYDILKKSHEFSIHAIINSILLWFLYFLAYYWTIRNIKNNYMPINAQSFAIFWATSWGMAIVNWFVPWSLLYFESFLLAFTAVWLYYYNNYKWNIYTSEEANKKNLEIIREWADAFPFPVVNYWHNWEPIIWNKEMEKETWYTFEEVLDYYYKNLDVMTLLYKWEDLEKVETYLYQIKNKTLDWYKDVTFTLTTKNWLKKTFSWTTKNLSYWWNVRIARTITDELELKRKIEETNNLLRTDSITWVLNRTALEEDMHILFSNKPKIFDKKIFVILDIDNFKTINDIYTHSFWDKVLIKIWEILRNSLRKWEDKIYRYWWDEFIIIMWDWDLDIFIKKFDFIRKKIYKTNFELNTWYEYSDIWTSWWVYEADLYSLYTNWETIKETTQKIQDIRNTIDNHMYAVKYYHLILDELIQKWKISSDIEKWKNWLAVDIYDKSWELIWVKVINDMWEFIIDIDELKLIAKRKEELSKTNSWSLR